MRFSLLLVSVCLSVADAFVRGEARPSVCTFDELQARRCPTALYAAKASKSKKAGAKMATAKKASAAKAVDTFKKADFVAAVSERTGMTKKDSEVAIQAVLETVMEEVGAGKRVNLAGFGAFTLKDRAARKGRNPQTGEEIDIAASKAPGFTAAKAWKDIVNGRA